MSQENVEIVRRHMELFWSGDLGGSLAAYDRDAVYDVSIRPEGRVYHGHAGVIEAVRTWAGTWEDWTAEVEEIIDAGDKVVVFDHHTGRGRGSGAPLDQHTAWVYTLCEGKIIQAKWFASRPDALEAAGLKE
jgi:ketosteroid isomerase-like protein